MSSFINNSYDLNTENKLGVVLAHFADTDYINDIINFNIINTRNQYYNQIPNIVGSFEHYFKTYSNMMPNEGDQQIIKNSREEAYKQILDILFNSFGIEYPINEDSDIYSIAYILYSFLVSDFIRNVTNFFTNYIVKEKNTLYDYLNLAESKKLKDSTTLYNKKMYKNSKLAIINANLERVIDNICVFDITLPIISNILFDDDKFMVKFLEGIQTRTDFFKTQYASLFQSPIRPILITEIRLQIQRISILPEEEQINNFVSNK